MDDAPCSAVRQYCWEVPSYNLREVWAGGRLGRAGGGTGVQISTPCHQDHLTFAAVLCALRRLRSRR
jgi:hypothetical protein